MGNTKYKAIVDGKEKFFNVGENNLEKFSVDHPEAVLVEDDFQQDPVVAETNAESDTNMVSQLEPTFLGSQSPGEEVSTIEDAPGYVDPAIAINKEKQEQRSLEILQEKANAEKMINLFKGYSFDKASGLQMPNKASDIFIQDEEESVKDLNAIYFGSGLKFYEENLPWLPGENYLGGTKYMNGVNIVKATLGGEQILMEFNTDNEGDWERAQEKLNRLIRRNAGALDMKKFDMFSEYEGKKVTNWQDTNKAIQIAPLDAENLFSLESKPNLFDKVVTSRYNENAYNRAPETTYTTTYPHIDMLKQVGKSLKAKNPKWDAAKLDAETKDTVRQVLKANYIDEVKRYERQDAIDAGFPQEDMYAGGKINEYYQAQEFNEVHKKQEINKEEVADLWTIAEVTNGYVYTAEEIANGLDVEHNELVAKFASNNGIFLDPMNTEMVTLADGTKIGLNQAKVIKALQINYNARSLLFDKNSKEMAELAGRIEDSDISIEMASLNYDLAEKAMMRMGLGATDILTGTMYIGGKIMMLTPIPALIDYGLGGVINDGLDYLGVEYTKLAQTQRNQFVREIEFKDAFGSDARGDYNTTKFVVQEVTNQIPVIAAMIMSGGQAGWVIGASSAGQKMLDMRTEMAMSPANDGKYSELEMWLKSAGYGIAEGGFAQLTTVAILKRAKSDWMTTVKPTTIKGTKLKSVESLVKDNTTKYIKSKYTNLIFDPLLEAAGEIGTIGVQNVIDGRDITIGMDHAGTSGLGFGLLFSGLPFFKGLYYSKFSSYESLESARKIQKQINQKTKKLKSLNDQIHQVVDGEIVGVDNRKKRIQDQKLLAKEIGDLGNELADVILTNEKLINNNLTGRAADNIIQITTLQVSLQNKAIEIANSGRSDADKTTEINKLKGQFEYLKAVKNKALSEEGMLKNETEWIAFQALDKVKAKEYLDEAKAMLLGEKNGKDSTKEQIDDLAYDLYFRDQIIEVNKTEDNNLNNSEFKSFNTVKEANAFLEDYYQKEINKLDPKENAAEIKKLQENLKDAKASFANGGDGFAIQGKYTIAVVDNQVLNQRKYIKTHEIGHQVSWDLLSSNKAAMDAMAAQLLKSLKALDKKTYNKFLETLGTEITMSEEVISRMIELIADKDGSFSTKAPGLAGMFGTMLEKQFGKQHNFNFRGESDMFNFFTGLALKIKDGTLTKEDLAAAKDNKIIKDLITKANEDGSTEAPSDIAASKGTNLEGLFDNYVNLNKNKERVRKGLPSLDASFKAKPEDKRRFVRGFVNKMLSEDVNGKPVNDFMKSRLVAESDTMGPYITTISNRIWNGVDQMNREGQTKETWKALVATELSSMIQQEYLKPKNGKTSYQTLDKFVRNRGYFRVFSLATATFKQTPATVGLDNATEVLDSKVDVKKQQQELDQLRKERENKIDFVNKVKFIDSDGKAIGLPSTVINAIINNIEKTFRTKKFKNPIGSNKFKTELANEYGGEIGSLFKKIMQRGEDFNNDKKLTREEIKANYSKFLSLNFDLINDLDLDVLNNKYPFLVENVLDKNGDKVWNSVSDSRAFNDKIDKGEIKGKKITNLKAGNYVFQKVTDTKKAKIDFIKYFEGDNESSQKKGARLLSLADELGAQSAYDLQGDVLRKTGYKTEAFIQDLDTAFNRGSVAFSAVNNLTLLDKAQFFQNFNLVTNIINPSSTNWGDRAAIERMFKGALGDVYPGFKKTDITAISKQLAGYASQFKLMDEVVKEDVDVSDTLDRYFFDRTFEATENETLKKYLKLKKPISDLYTKESIEKARGAVLDFIRRFPEGSEARRQAIIDIIQNKSMYTGAGRIAAGQFVTKDGSVTERPSGQDTDLIRLSVGKIDLASGDARQGYQVFENINDFYKHLNDLGDIEIDIPNSKNRNKSWLKIDGKEVMPSEISLIAETSEAGIKDKDFAGRLEQAKDARRFVKEMMEMYVDGYYDNSDLAMLMKQMDSQMLAPLKRAANLEFVTPGLLAKDAAYEHMLPTNFVLMNLVKYYKGDRANAGVNADKLFKEYKVAIIPKKMDNFLTKIGLQSKMVVNYVIGDPSWKRYYNIFTFGNPNFRAIKSINPDSSIDLIGESWELAAKAINKKNLYEEVKQNEAETKAINNGNTIAYSAAPKGISVWDFDDTLAQTKSKVLYALPDGTKGKIDATEFAIKSADLEAVGAKFDFSEFNKVMKGSKGPMFDKAVARNKKFGNSNVFILTARPQAAANAIHVFLKGIGLDIRLENIVGLEDGTAKAKADWMITKIADGYNDFYFADDAIKNVKAVKQIYDNFDIKGKVQIAKIAFSRGLSEDFNDMIERQTGVESVKEFSKVVARRRGKNKGGFKFFIPASAEDFRGLTQYIFAGKGKQGEADQKFFEDSLMDPYFRGVAQAERARQRIADDIKGLLTIFKPVVKKLNKLIPGGDYTFDAAIRVYLWTRAGEVVPGISKRDQKKLNDLVANDSELSAYADALLLVSGKEVWPSPTEFWDTQTTLSDLNSLTEKVNRKEYLKEFIENADVIFTETNLNKIEALYGKSVRESIEDSLHAMKTGSNRTSGTNAITGRWLNWVNNSIGTIMFFNRKSALLQTISSTNFINWSDNNILKAGMAFANQKQYWKDFVMIFNSAKLRQRRAGLKSDVQEAEIANAAKNAKDKASAVISYLLKIGFTPTQIADSFAIASGGAAMYRNRVNTYIKEGMSKVDAEAKAFEDFSKISDEAQQSGDPALVSSQQRSVAGRLILAFQNTPMQYTRLMKKAGQDLINGRGDAKTHVSKIIYYGAVQNFIFNALQSALFALIPGFDEEEKDDETLEKNQAKKQTRILNGMVDSILRGSGIYGAVMATLKNTFFKFREQEEKGFTADHTYTILEAANISPPIGSKLRKVYSAIQTYRFDKDVIKKHPWNVSIDGRYNPSPNFTIAGNLASALFNIPLDRALVEAKSISEMLDTRNTSFQRVALGLGWRQWDVNAKNEEFDLIKLEAKMRRKKEGIEKGKATRELNKLKKRLELENMDPAERLKLEQEAAKKRSESAKKGAATRKENTRIKDSTLIADMLKLSKQYL